MTQIILINDTGTTISAPAEITLDGVNKVPPIRYINSGALVMMGSAATSLATTIVLAATATAPASAVGDYAYRSASNKIKLGVDMETWHLLVLDVELEDDYVRT